VDSYRLPGKAAAERLDELRIWRHALLAEGCLEVFDEAGPELDVLLGATDQIVETEASERQFLCGTNPSLRRRRQPPEELADACFVVSAHGH
jgi:hypothetical protein